MLEIFLYNYQSSIKKLHRERKLKYFFLLLFPQEVLDSIKNSSLDIFILTLSSREKHFYEATHEHDITVQATDDNRSTSCTHDKIRT